MDIKVTPETKKGIDQVRINVSAGDAWGVVNGLVIVGADGWHYDKYDTVVDAERKRFGGIGSGDPSGKQVRISSNGPLRLSREEWELLRDTIDAELAGL